MLSWYWGWVALLCNFASYAYLTWQTPTSSTKLAMTASTQSLLLCQLQNAKTYYCNHCLTKVISVLPPHLPFGRYMKILFTTLYPSCAHQTLHLVHIPSPLLDLDRLELDIFKCYPGSFYLCLSYMSGTYQMLSNVNATQLLQSSCIAFPLNDLQSCCVKCNWCSYHQQMVWFTLYLTPAWLSLLWTLQ